MKKQELIKHIEDLPYKDGPIVDKIDISRKGLLELVRQLDEPQPVKVKQFVANWYEKHKYALEFNIFDYVYRFEQQAKNDFKDWFDDTNNKAIQILVNMHQFGYEVEKEKQYRVKFIQTRQHLAKNIFPSSEYFIIKTSSISSTDSFTQKELEEAGFGWVFDCPGIKIEEVKDE